MSSSGRLPIVIFGCGGHGRVVADTLKVARAPLVGFLDDGRLLRSFAAAIAFAGLVRFWFLPPARRLPAHRVRYLRLRVHLRPRPRLRNAAALWWRWGRLAGSAPLAGPAVTDGLAGAPAGKRALGSDRPGSLPARLRVPVEEHVLVMAPPRTGKTGLLASVILHYPGPVISTTTKHDVFELTSGSGPAAGRCTCSTRSASAACRRRSAGPRSTAARTGGRDPPRGRVRARGVTERRRGRHLLVAKASDYLRAYFHAAALAGADMRTVARGSAARTPTSPRTFWLGRRRAVGDDPGGAAVGGAEDRVDGADGHVTGAVVHGRPGAGRVGPARDRNRSASRRSCAAAARCT